MRITYLRHNQIDKPLWDKRVAQSNQLVPYALSWYLDIVSPQWEALVTDDYKHIMPLPLKQKSFLKYLVQPQWSQQLGIISTQALDKKTVDAFIKAIPYKIYALNLNSDNHNNKYNTQKLNLCLDLNKPYVQLQTQYSSNTKRNIKKAAKENLSIENITTDEFLNFWKPINKMGAAYAKNLEQIIAKATQHNCAKIICAKTPQGETIAALFALNMPKHIVYLAPVSNTEGKRTNAMALIVDSIIQENQNTNKILDFEGSMIPSIARFYRGFGAAEHHYYTINNLYPEKLLLKIKNFIHK